MNKIFFAVIVFWSGIISGCASNPPVSAATKTTTLDAAEKAQSELSSAVNK